MLNIAQFYKDCKNMGISFFTGVPDSLMNDFCLFLEQNLDYDEHVIAANEGNAVAIAAGHHLSSGQLSMVYMQNSGFTNAINPLSSLVNKDMYSIPMVLLIGWRGDPRIKDHAQHFFLGSMMENLLELLNIDYQIINNGKKSSKLPLEWAAHTALKYNKPVALLVGKNVLSKTKKIENVNVNIDYLSRYESMEVILDKFSQDSKFVATTGRTSRELYHLRIDRDESHTNDILNVGAMGHASSIAIGIANANKKHNVICLDGDGALIMHLGALSTEGKLGLDNYFHIVLNNQSHESVGGQATASKFIDLTSIAKNSGLRTVDYEVSSSEAIIQAIQELAQKKGPKFLEVKIRQGISENLPPLEIGSYIDMKNDFMKIN